jgi:hypothetical protein
LDKRFRILFLLFPLAGCAGAPTYVPLTAETKDGLDEVAVRTVIVQDEVILTAPASGLVQAAGGGLAAALIESSIAKGRQDRLQSIVEPFYAQVDDVDFRKQFWGALVPYLKGSYPVKIGEVKTTPVMLSPAEQEKAVAALPPGRGLMFVRTRYGFAEDFKKVEVYTQVDLWRGGSKPSPALSNVYLYRSAPVGKGNDESIAQWSELSGELYRRAVAEGIDETLKMFAADVGAMEVARLGTNTALNDGPTRGIRRNNEGRLLSIPRYGLSWGR